MKYGSSYVLELAGEIRLGAVELRTFCSVHGLAASVLLVVHGGLQLTRRSLIMVQNTHKKNVTRPYPHTLFFVSPVFPFLYGSEINVRVHIMGKQ